MQLLNYADLKKEVETADFKKLELIAEAKGYKKGWIFYQLKTVEQLKKYAEYKGYNPSWVYYQLSQKQ